jgi:putative phage-type endonuclease
MSREEWLAFRRGSIGGSEAAALVGLSRWASPFTVWADKLGMTEAKPENEAMRIGKDLEEYVAKRWCEATGKKVRRENNFLVNPDYPFAHATVDRLVIGEDAGLECKTTTLDYDFSAGKIPDWYYAQCVHYMATLGFDRMYLAILDLRHRKFYWFKIERNEEEVKSLMEQEERFWNDHVLKQIPPETDGSEASGNAVRALYNDPALQEDTPVLLHEMGDLLERYMATKIQMNALKMEQEEIEQKVQAKLGNSTLGTTNDYKVTWKFSERSSVDTKALREDRPDIYEKYTKKTVSRTMRISVR